MGWRAGNPEPGQPFDPRDFSPYDTDWNQEFVAGWLDGFRAAKVAVVNLARLELARYGLTVADTGEVQGPWEGAVDPCPLEQPLPDNPEGCNAYEEGWGAGYEEGHQAMLRRLREQLEERSLFVSDGGAVTSMGVVSDLVDQCRRLEEDEQDLLQLSDHAIHAFIDGAGGVPPGSASGEQGGRKARAGGAVGHHRQHRGGTRKGWRRKLAGVWEMVRREVDRRTAVVALGSVLVTSGLGWVAWRPGGPRPGPQEPPAAMRTQTPPGYTAPTFWDSYPSEVRDTFLAWDQHVWQLEQANNLDEVRSTISNIMLMTGKDDLKANIATYVMAQQRGDLADVLLPGVHPAVSGLTARMTILTALYKLHLDGAMDPIPSSIGDILVAYQALGVEPHPNCQVTLNQLVSAYLNQ